jgi:hypothetical protein
MGKSQDLTAFESQSQNFNAKAQRRKETQRKPEQDPMLLCGCRMFARLAKENPVLALLRGPLCSFDTAQGRLCFAVGFYGVSHA